MTTRIRRTLGVVAAGLMVLSLAACTNGPSHKKAVNKASEHWRSMRTAMMLQMAQQYFDTGDLDRCELTLRDATAIDPTNARLMVLSGRVALERGQLERAYHLLGAAAELDAKLPDPQYYQGVVLQRWQQYEGALQRYQKAYELQPDNVAYLLAIGEMLVALDRSDEALALLTGKMTYFDQNAGIRVAIGQIHLMKHEPAKAVDYFRQAALLQPDDPQTVEALALAQAAAGQHGDAIKNLEHLRNQPAYADRRDIQQALAGCYFAAGRYADAKAGYVALTRTQPDDVDAWLHLGQTAWAMNDLSGALLAAQRVTALEPKRHDGHLLAGMVWQKRGQLPRALEEFDQAAKLAPASNQALILRGLALQQAGQKAAAAEAYAQALERQPEDVRVQRLLAQVSAQPVQP